MAAPASPMESYPSSTAYAEALQNTSLCFCLDSLKGGRVKTSPLGMPWPISGNNASVFQITDSSGKEYAIKCFTRYTVDQQERYAAVSQALEGLSRPWIVPVRYEPKGILVAGIWYPVVQMDWINATGLIPWIERNVDDKDAMEWLATEFASIVGDLRRLGYAHGDLQHGNLLVDRAGQLRLIDYDGMYLPQLRTRGATEHGHVNYQAPVRTGSEYSPDLDDFSAWLIYCSILLLLAEPWLWPQLHTEGAEQLLFGKRDFDDAKNSLSLVQTIPNRSLGPVVQQLQVCWQASSLAEVPPFEPSLLPPPAELAGRSSRTHSAAESSPSSVDPGSNDRLTPASYAGGASWLADHLPSPMPVTFDGSKSITRIGLGTLAASEMASVAAALITPAIAGLCAFISALLFLLLTWRGYSSRPEVAAKRKSWQQVASCRKALRTIDRELASLGAQLHTEQGIRQNKIQQLQADQAKAASDEAAELGRALTGFAAEKKDIESRIQSIGQREAASHSQSLQKLQEDYVQLQLRRRTVAGASLKGVGPAITAKLAQAGFSTAADVKDLHLMSQNGRYGQNDTAYLVHISGRRVRVDGVGPTRAREIVSWAKRLRAEVQSRTPRSLPSAEAASIRARFQQERQLLMNGRAALDQRMLSARNAVNLRWQPKHMALRGSQTAIDQAFNFKTNSIRVSMNSAEQARRSMEWHEKKATKATATYAAVTLRRYVFR